MNPKSLLLATLCLAVSPQLSAAESFYTTPKLFSQRPDETKSMTLIHRFGPVGMAIELIHPVFTMRVKSTEEGSPAAATGKFKAGQIITSINGETLKDIDPRIQLGNLITAAEASDGILKFAIEGEAEPVVVKIPVLGAYSPNWPLDCPKSNKIVRGLADYIASPDGNKGMGAIGMIFLMSTGEEKDTAAVAEWAHKVEAPTIPWFIGFSGIPLCEYYLRTGDKTVLPTIQKFVDNAVAVQYHDAWSGRGGAPAATYGGGHLNAGGTSTLTLLLLAKECGAEVPESNLLGGLRHFYRYAGKGGNPYGDGRPEVGFVDNGKNGNLAFAMAAAAALTPDGEKSVYAAARDNCAMTAFPNTSFMLHGHTGGGIGEIWRSGSMGLLRDKKPKQYRDFMDNRRWHYELSRRFDGSFGIYGGEGYDKEQWGVAYGWAYTVPRKKMRIFGAPPTKFSKPYTLPALPWGTEADKDFVALDAASDAKGNKQDLSGETLANAGSIAFLQKIHNKEKIVSDDDLRGFIHHPDAAFREIAAGKVLGFKLGYLGWVEPGGDARPALMMEFLQSPSPRVRRAMFSQVAARLQDGTLPKEVFDLAAKSLADPAESWWVKDAALHVVSQGQADWVLPHVDLLLPYLKHQEWWLANAAIKALTPLVNDKRAYQKVIPAITEAVRTNSRPSLALGLPVKMREILNSADPEIQQLAIQSLSKTYSGFTGTARSPGGLNQAHHVATHMDHIAASLAGMPGGIDVLYELSRQRYPDQILPHKQLFLSADPTSFGAKLKKAIKPVIEQELVPEHVGKNRMKLREFANSEVQAVRGGPDLIDNLVSLHQRTGTQDFNWHAFTALREAEWSYHTFDPIPAEQVPFDQLATRYRKVTLPKGMENWFTTEFDPDKAGWRRGKAPFGQYAGRIPDGPVSKCDADCTGPVCFGAQKPNTLWDKEVLLMRKKVEVPPLKDGHRYRLRVIERNHVGCGGGFHVWVNGKPIAEMENCIGRGGSGKAYGAYITREWLDDFRKGEVTIALISFLRDGDQYSVKPKAANPQGWISVEIEEQKLPPIGDDLVMASAKVVPMLTSEWQAAQFSDSDEEKENAPAFRWDGKIEPNPAITGDWKLIGEVATIAEFDPAKKKTARSKFASSLSFASDGISSDPLRIATGKYLLDLNSYQALRMETQTVAGKKFLFVESGGFSERNKPGWTSPWLVFEKK